MHTMDINHILENIGLNPKEIKIYLALLQNGPMSILEIARESHIKRTTIYPFIISLKEKRLVDIGLSTYNKKIKAREPKQLLQYAKSQERTFGRAVLHLSEELNNLEKLYRQDFSEVEVKYYEGIDECREMLSKLLEVKGEILSYSSWMKYPYIGEGFCKKLYQKIHLLKNFTGERELVSGTEHNLWHAQEYIKLPTYNKKYLFRFIPPKKEFIKVDTYLFNDIKMVVSFKGVKPNGIYIKNKDMVDSEKAVFEVLYTDVALEYEEYLKKYNIDKSKLTHKHE
jgi:sugar-specific transcriptional regulator TrmB